MKIGTLKLKNPSAFRVIANEQNLDLKTVMGDMKKEIAGLIGDLDNIPGTGYMTSIGGITGKHIVSSLYNHGSRYSYVTDGINIMITRPNQYNWVEKIGY